MVKASKGLRRKTRNILGKTPRTKGMSPITHEFRNFEVGEKVNVVIDPAVIMGCPICVSREKLAWFQVNRAAHML